MLDGGAEDDGAEADAKLWGIELPAESLAADAEGLWAEHLPALAAFLAVATQWRVAGIDGRVLGLDYGGARAGLDLAGIDATPSLWRDLRVIEQGALAAMREARA